MSCVPFARWHQDPDIARAASRVAPRPRSRAGSAASHITCRCVAPLGTPAGSFRKKTLCSCKSRPPIAGVVLGATERSNYKHLHITNQAELLDPVRLTRAVWQSVRDLRAP